MALSLCFYESVYKTCQQQLTELKLGKLIAHSKFHKICKFESHVIRNDVIMTSLPKQWKMRTSAKPNKLYIIGNVLMRAIQKCTFLLNLSHYIKSYGHLCQFLAFFTMPALQIWPCHVTQEANFKKIIFFLILHLILGKGTKFLVEKLSTSEVISQKPHGVCGKHPPPSAFRVCNDCYGFPANLCTTLEHIRRSGVSNTVHQLYVIIVQLRYRVSH